MHYQNKSGTHTAGTQNWIGQLKCITIDCDVNVRNKRTDTGQNIIFVHTCTKFRRVLHGFNDWLIYWINRILSLQQPFIQNHFISIEYIHSFITFDSHSYLAPHVRHNSTLLMILSISKQFRLVYLFWNLPVLNSFEESYSIPFDVFSNAF